MAEQLIHTELEEGVFLIYLDRPDKLNSFTEPMARQLQEALDEGGHSREVRCVLLTGEGRAFSSGQDLMEVLGKSDSDEDYRLEDTVRASYNPIIKAIRYMEKPVVCAVNGTAAGAGANIALACDIVLASKEASFVQSFSKIGLIPDSGGTFFLPRLVGLQRANVLYMLDERIPAEEAARMGLIYKAVEADALMDEARSIGRKLAGMPTRGFGLYKQAVNRSLQNDLEDQLDLEADLQTEAGKTDDYAEGVRAFLEKRKPEFKGK
ncbi:MAG: enoyl-CoA hydratase-related protein [Balneolaceae bacterium]|nr:enoyl-CoA hydratase-related protein [Balneolaceae bacterium]